MNSYNFNNKSEEYCDILSSALAGYGDVDYFAKNKVRIMRRMFSYLDEPKTILDFGCGIGNNLSHLRNYFPNAKLFAFDVASESLDIAVRSNVAITPITEDSIDNYKETFEAVFISNVFHHVEPKNRDHVVQRIRRLLTDNGSVIVFEHNPFNPITCRIVKDCEFDRHALLLTKKELVSIFNRNHLSVVRSCYTLFVPPKLKKLDFINSFLYWLPLGAQYCAMFRKCSL